VLPKLVHLLNAGANDGGIGVAAVVAVVAVAVVAVVAAVDVVAQVSVHWTEAWATRLWALHCFDCSTSHCETRYLFDCLVAVVAAAVVVAVVVAVVAAVAAAVVAVAGEVLVLDLTPRTETLTKEL
jgi:hypothetical protein